MHVHAKTYLVMQLRKIFVFFVVKIFVDHIGSLQKLKA